MPKDNTNSTIIFTSNIYNTFIDTISKMSITKIFLLVDENTKKHCLPLLPKNIINDSKVICTVSGEENKTIESIQFIWKELLSNNADKKSLLINIGGGLLSDIGGFAAATFKRGMYFINIPTTLLSQIDASIGGKTGFNFGGFKNQIGLVQQAEFVLISPEFLKTLSTNLLLSGYAEMIKHALLDSHNHFELIKHFNPKNIQDSEYLEMLKKSASVKKKIYTQDPYEKGIRKGLNLGHTFGHAFESLSHKKANPIEHGHAVAIGLIAELYLSVKKCQFPVSLFQQISNFILYQYDPITFSHEEIETIFNFVLQDKKNENGTILLTLLKDIGSPIINQICSKEEITETLIFLLKQKPY